jgi:hypothetical protein
MTLPMKMIVESLEVNFYGVIVAFGAIREWPCTQKMSEENFASAACQRVCISYSVVNRRRVSAT